MIIFKRITGTFFTTASLSVLLGTGIAGPLGDMPVLPAEQAAAPGLVHSPLDRVLPLIDAMTIADQQDLEAVGFGYANGPVAGEFFPSESKNATLFLAEFRAKFDSEPQVTSIISSATLGPKDGARGEVEEKKSLIEELKPQTIRTGAKVDFIAPRIDSSSLRPSQKISEVPKDFLAERTAENSWKPEVVDVEIKRNFGLVDFSQMVTWDAGSSPANIIDNFGLEFEINLYNDKSIGIKQPLCELGYENQFAAHRPSVTDWQIVASGDTVASDLQPYWDTVLEDECSRMSFSVGVRYPQLIEPDEFGHFAYVTWSADETEEDLDRLDASLQLVDDVECDLRDLTPLPGDTVLPWCMGYWQVEPPASAENPRAVLNNGRNIYGPDFCWRSGNSGDEGGYKPTTSCGPGIDWDAVPITTISPKSGNASTGWDVTMTHQSDDLDWAVFPYSDTLPAISPHQPSDLLDPERIVDVRAWIDGEPVDVVFEGWEFEKALPVNNRFTLTNENLKVGDGSAITMAKFFRNGALSFRKGLNAEVNWIKLDQLHELWDPDAFDPFNCAVGSNQEGSDQTQRNSVRAGYGDSCEFGVEGVLSDTTGFGEASYSDATPGYLFQAQGSSGWIPREEHSIWRPSNGSTITVAYMDPATSALISFYSGVQNAESTYLSEPIELSGYDTNLPTTEIEISNQLFTDIWSWDCRWVVEETPACESYRTNFDLRTEIGSPSAAQGPGWRNLADSGGTITFTSSQGTPIVLTLLPGSYYSEDLSMPGGASRSAP
ncbi:MAG: hypothetical protein ACSHW9_08015 [Salinibacterium amurskyense]